MTQNYAADREAVGDFESIDTESLPGTWREAPRTWGNPLHKLAPYVGGFPPALAHYFIDRYSEPGDTVLDPFCGGAQRRLKRV
ncbi:DNA methyltransferase [Salinigranum rubrum]|uniref:DNA methyltransferase n=1 Tax=Salinigranum rubrum TaxID=755307 RepID=UPI001C1FAADE